MLVSFHLPPLFSYEAAKDIHPPEVLLLWSLFFYLFFLFCHSVAGRRAAFRLYTEKQSLFLRKNPRARNLAVGECAGLCYTKG